MIEKICKYILKKMRKKLPDITDEKAEEILYGLQLLIGELPKVFILFGLSFILGIGWYMVFAYVALTPYRVASGGFHAHTHLGCIIASSVIYYGNILLSKALILDNIQKYILIVLTLIFGLLMVNMYAPADTENVPIISKKERKNKKIISFITLIITLIAATLIQDRILSNILIIGTLIQTFSITRIAYKLTNNKYGHEVYAKQEN